MSENRDITPVIQAMMSQEILLVLILGRIHGRDDWSRTEFRQRWPDVDLVQIKQPFCGLAVRFQNSVYAPSDEKMPETISIGVQEISLQVPDVRFVLLRTECCGGECSNWGQFTQNGQLLVNQPPRGSHNKGALQRLLSNFHVDAGTSEIFEPLSRDFSWKPGQ